MRHNEHVHPHILVSTVAILLLSACDNQGTTPASPKPATRAEEKPLQAPAPTSITPAKPALPAASPSEPEVHAHPPTPSPPAKSPSTLSLEGLTMTVPKGWMIQVGKPGPLAPKAVYRLPKAEGDTVDATVRVTHFPGMKGMDEANINRWVGQVKRPDGTPSTRDDAKVSTVELGPVRLTIVDVGGTVKMDAPTPHGAGMSNQRMIAAIVDHAKGPHFIKAFGPAATIEKWQEAVQSFLKSASAEPK